jgi:hypothetical protein
MNLSAFLLMFFVQGIIALITFYLFYRVLKSGKNKEGKDRDELR